MWVLQKKTPSAASSEDVSRSIAGTGGIMERLTDGHSVINRWSQRSPVQLTTGVKKPTQCNSSAFRIMAATRWLEIQDIKPD